MSELAELMFGVPLAERHAAQLEDLEGAAHSNEIIGVEPGGAGRIHPCELRVQRCAPLRRGALLVGSADAGSGGFDVMDTATSRVVSFSAASRDATSPVTIGTGQRK